MKSDLKNMNRKELEKLRARVDKALERLGKRELKEARAAAEKAAAQHGFSLSDLTGENALATKKGRAPAKPRSASAPKYRNPNDPDSTWTGKGRQPGWYKDAIAAGKTPESMEI